MYGGQLEHRRACGIECYSKNVEIVWLRYLVDADILNGNRVK